MKTIDIISELWDLLSPHAKKLENDPNIYDYSRPMWMQTALSAIPSGGRDIFVAGSIRRRLWAGQQIPDDPERIHDVEIVARIWWELYVRLDELKAKNIITDTYPKNWGERMKKFVFRGLKFDLFLYDDDNRGYQSWLRTGPGDANEYAVKPAKGYVVRDGAGVKIMNYGAPFVIRGGYLWDKSECTPVFEAPKDDEKDTWYWDTSHATKLSVPTEKDFLYLMGLGNMPPHLRTEKYYREIMGKNHQWGDIKDYLMKKATPPPIPTTLF